MSTLARIARAFNVPAIRFELDVSRLESERRHRARRRVARGGDGTKSRRRRIPRRFARVQSRGSARGGGGGANLRVGG